VDKLPKLNSFRSVYVLLAWVIIVIGFVAALQISLSQVYDSVFQNALVFALIFGLAAFIGGSMIMLAELVNIALRIENRLDDIRNISEKEKTIAQINVPEPVFHATDEMSNLKAKFKGANFNDAMYYYQRGMANRKAGNLSTAKEDFIKAFDMGISDPYTEEAKGKAPK